MEEQNFVLNPALYCQLLDKIEKHVHSGYEKRIEELEKKVLFLLDLTSYMPKSCMDNVDLNRLLNAYESLKNN